MCVDLPRFPVLDPIRFGPERELIDGLFERYGLDVLIDHFVESGGVRSAYDAVLGSKLRLTPILAPRLVGLLGEVRTRLGFTEPLELFVGQDPVVNASAMHAIAPDEPHVLELTSGLVERMTDDELRFVLGHEVGHLAYRHYRARLSVAAFGVDEQEESKAPPLLVRRLESWDRMAEISADRAGLIVVDHRLDVAVSAFFKLQSGLGPEHLRFDVQALLDQLSAIERLPRRELLAQFSHPATPIRVRALQLFAEAVVASRPVSSIDAEVATLARLMDFAPSEPLDVHARDFLLAGSLLLGEADPAGMDDDEWDAMVAILLPLSADPEAEVPRLASRDAARTLVEQSGGYLKDNAGPERFELLRAVAHVAAADGTLTTSERALLHELADILGIPARSADEVAFETLADHLQIKAMRGTPSFPSGFPRRAARTAS